MTQPRKWKRRRRRTNTSAPVTVRLLRCFFLCWQLPGPEGGPVSWSRRGSATLVNHGKPHGALPREALQHLRHSHHQLNQLLPLQTELLLLENFFSFERRLCPHMRNQSVKTSKIRKNEVKEGNGPCMDWLFILTLNMSCVCILAKHQMTDHKTAQETETCWDEHTLLFLHWILLKELELLKQPLNLCQDERPKNTID